MKNLKNFDEYAKFYDLVYEKKSYLKELSFISQKLNINKNSTIIDLGCGTLRHSINLLTKVKKILGIDLSKKMLKIAKIKVNKKKLLKKELFKKKLYLKYANIINFSSNQKFNTAYSLFDVISLLISDKDIKKFFLNLYNHLEPGSLVYLDYWYKPAVHYLKIKDIKQTYENLDFKIIREKTQTMNKKKNYVNVIFKFNVYNKKNKKNHYFEEKHPMRFFSTSEIEKFSKKFFNIKQHLSGYSNSKPSKKKWQASSILIRK
jgi:SAM-dependent methyltransferase